jgi:hypothetical protein
MSNIDRLIERSAVHEDWQPILRESLLTLDPDYLDSLLRDDDWLPGVDRLLAAFQRDRAGVRYLLIGESPYPRKAARRSIAPRPYATWSKPRCLHKVFCSGMPMAKSRRIRSRSSTSVA